jgi:hypothetical protein
MNAKQGSIRFAEGVTMRLAEIWKRWRPDPDDDVSFAGIVYVAGLLAVLLLVHVLQPEREGSGSSSPLPIHKEKSAP